MMQNCVSKSLRFGVSHPCFSKTPKNGSFHPSSPVQSNLYTSHLFIPSLPRQAPIIGHFRILEVFKMTFPLLAQLIRVWFSVGLLVGILIKALGVSRISDGWNDWPSVLPVVYLIPKYASEERMVFDSLRSTCHVSQAV